MNGGLLTPPPPTTSWYEYLGWPLKLQLLLILLAAAICCWQLTSRAAREQRFPTLLAVVLVLVTLPGWLGLAAAGMELSRDFYRETGSHPHGPMPDEAYAAPWAYGLLPLLVGLVLCLPGYLLTMGILCRRAFRTGSPSR